MTPAPPMIVVFAIASQAKSPSSWRPSSGVTSGGGVELPGVGVYGVWYEEGLSVIHVRQDPAGPGSYDLGWKRAPRYAANQGRRAAGPDGLSTRIWRFGAGSPGA